MLSFLFPRRCVLCRKLLETGEHYLCRKCDAEQPEFRRPKRNIPNIAQWTALWYYRDNVRYSIHRFKFGRSRGNADYYAMRLAQKLDAEALDLISWVPVSPLRRLRRGYDQAQLLAVALGKELGLPVKQTLKKVRHTPPQSGLRDYPHRKANVLNAYRAVAPSQIRGKRILLVDDVVTTGATAEECAKVLVLSNVEDIFFAAVAAAENHKK